MNNRTFFRGFGPYSWIKYMTYRLKSVAMLATTLVFGGLVVPSESASASGATGLTLSIVSDDTAASVNDTSTTNGLVPVTGGQLTYRWGWSGVSVAGDTVFSQTLPVGVTWNAASIAAGCAVTGSFLTSGETLTCTLAGLADIPGTTDKTATVKNLTNGTVISSKLVSGTNESDLASVTAAGTSQVQVRMYRGAAAYMTDATSPEDETTSGLQVPFSIAAFVPGTSSDQHKGQESLGSNLNFSLQITVPENAEYISCGVTSLYSQNSGTGTRLPTFAAGPSALSSRVADSGSLICSQSGNQLTVTFSGVDGRLNHVPTGHAEYYPSMGLFALGGFYLWMPGSAFNSVTETNVTVTAGAKDFTSEGGLISTTTASSVSYPIKLAAFALNSSSSSSGSPYPGGNYNQTTTLSVPSGSGQSATSSQVCQVWDNSLQRIRSTTQPSSVSSTNFSSTVTAANFTVEYGTQVYSSNEERRAADCGTVGDGATGWFSSIAAAGGVAEVSAVRIRFNRSIDPGKSLSFSIGMTAPTSKLLAPSPSDPSGTTQLSFYPNRKSDQTDLVRLAVGTNPPNTILSTASVRNRISFTETDVRPGGTATITVTPTVTTGNVAVADGRLAVGVTQTITLPNGCFTFVPGTPAPISVTPSTPESPSEGEDCTDVDGQTIVWSLGDVSTSTGASPISFAVNVSPATPTPVIATISSLIASTSDKASTTTRTSTDTINVNTVNQFQVSLTSSSANVTSGIPFTYRVGWKNAATSDIDGSAWVVNVLPFDDDGRGTTGLGGIDLDSVATNPVGLSLEYTTDNPQTVLTQLSSDQSGGTGITWVSVDPGAGVTAVRVRTQALAAGAAGYMDLTVTPQTFIKGGTIANDVYAKADSLPTGFTGTEDLSLDSSSSEIVGFVYQDLDYSGSKDDGDDPVAGKEVRLTGFNFGVNGINNTGSSSTISGDDEEVTQTTTTDADGSYSFTVSPGVYTVEVDETYDIGGVVSDLITFPDPRFEVSGAVTVSGKNFGYQEPISPPIAVDDNPESESSLVIYQGESVEIDILSNDTTYVPDGVPATEIESYTEPARGSIVFNEEDTVTYTANAIWPGSVTGTSYDSTFEYTLSNPQGTSTATVTVRVLRLPSVTADSLVAGYQLSASKNVLANDFGIDIEIDGGTIDALGNGSAVLSGGQITYTSGPYIWASGETSFSEEVSYGIVDSNGKTATGTLTVTVYRAPVASNDAATTAFETAKLIDVLDNDLSGRSSLSLSITSAPSQGTAEVVGDAIRFTPEPSQTGVVTFSYSVTDDLLQAGTATVTITITDELVAVDDGSEEEPIRVDQSGTTIDVLGNDLGSSIEVTSVSNPTNGVAVEDSGLVTYTPTSGYEGPDSFSYTITDLLGGTASAVVYLEVVRTAGKPGRPTAVAGNAEATVTVLPPSTGDTPTSYVVTSNPGGFTCDVTPPAESCTITGLTNGTNYTFTVVAYVGSTASIASDASSPVRPVEPPSTLGVPVGSAGNSSVTLTWDPPVIGTAPFTYTIEVDPDTDPSSYTCVVSSSGSGTNAVCSGLTNGTEYRFRVTASNGAPTTAQSDFSAPVIPIAPPNRPRPVTSIPTSPPEPPKQSEILFSDAGKNLQVSIIGQIVSGVSEYKIRLTPGNRGCAVSLPLTTCEIDSLKPLTEYRVIVSASNQAGSSTENLLKTRLFLSPNGWLEFEKKTRVKNPALAPKDTPAKLKQRLTKFAERHDFAKHITCVARVPRGTSNARIFEQAASKAKTTCKILNSRISDATHNVSVKQVKSQLVQQRVNIRLYSQIGR